MPRQSCYVKGPIEEQGPYYFDLRYFQQFIFLKPFLPWPVSFDAQAGYYYLLYRFHPWLSVSSITTSATQWICFKERQTRLTNNKRFVRIFYFFLFYRQIPNNKTNKVPNWRTHFTPLQAFLYRCGYLHPARITV